MQSTNAPNKFLVPFATGDGAKVEIPLTTSDATRASQTLGFPPLTMQPPEVGGVPPQGEDFNGAMNQIARVAWWAMLGNLFPYDATFATSASIGGYPKGALVRRADMAGFWINGADNNQTNPDDNTGLSANWLPGTVYGSASIAVSTTTLIYPVNAAFKTLNLTGTLTANSVVELPAWAYAWDVIDNTVRGGFSLTVKTVSGTGIAITPGAQTLRGDGTNITQNVVTTTRDPTFADNSTKPASTGWIRGAMSAIAIAAGFAISLGVNGYVKLPSWLGGLVIQWGSVAVPSAENTDSTTTFGIAFPNVCRSIVITDSATTTNNAVVWATDNINAANFTSHWARSGLTLAGTNRSATYIAIGN
jgi:hypothetical protein